jgi:hypothetical protein
MEYSKKRKKPKTKKVKHFKFIKLNRSKKVFLEEEKIDYSKKLIKKVPKKKRKTRKHSWEDISSDSIDE